MVAPRPEPSTKRLKTGLFTGIMFQRQAHDLACHPTADIVADFIMEYPLVVHFSAPAYALFPNAQGVHIHLPALCATKTLAYLSLVRPVKASGIQDVVANYHIGEWSITTDGR